MDEMRQSDQVNPDVFPEKGDNPPQRWKKRRPNRSRKNTSNTKGGDTGQPLYAAIDLGTNNCRLLIVTPEGKNFRVVDSFSRIVRLGEGLDKTGRLSEEAMDRALAALRVCAGKVRKYNVKRMRCVATEACRDADNGAEFIARVSKETRLNFQIIGARDEAELASVSCGALFDRKRPYVIVLDIGGGSTEISYLRLESGRFELKDTRSFPLGVVRLAERYDGRHLSQADYDQMREECAHAIRDFVESQSWVEDLSKLQVVGTSGTVTTLVAIQLGLKYYDRSRVDGTSMSLNAVRDVIKRLLGMSRKQLAAQPCIGPDRADLVLTGCAILEAFLEFYPVPSIKVADRGLREGILLRLIRKDQRGNRKGRRKMPPRKQSGKAVGHAKR
ncbi:MAG: Ppx/GppA family phosphatase [Parvibaculales bacterium]